MIVAGTVNYKMASRVKRLYHQMPDPKYVIAMGACTVGGGPYFKYGYNVVKGVDLVVPVEDFAAVYEAAGFTEIDARLIERPTPLPKGIGQWVTTFRRGWLDRAGVPEGERAEIGEAVAASIASNNADYVRLRFIMRKPN